MKILLLGKDGQVGWELQRSLAPLGELIALDRNGRDDLCGDLCDLQRLSRTIASLGPQVVVNAAAYTAVDRAETERDLATRVNAQAPDVLATAVAASGGLLVHYSTDYVFDGSGSRAWCEADSTGPLSHYGASKLSGEEAIRASGCDYLILRSSWVYAARGANFLRSILRLAGERESLNIVSDQCGVPTGAELIADVSALAIRDTIQDRGLGGVYHLAASGETSWYDYAQLVVEQARLVGRTLAVKHIDAIPTIEYPTPARRPLNSRLNTQKLRNSFSISFPDWKEGVARAVKELTGTQA